MARARGSGSAALRAVLVLAAFLLAEFPVSAQTTRKTAVSKKKPASVTAVKRPKGAISRSFVATDRRKQATTRKPESSSGTARSRNRRVVVTRKLVHGRWVRTTQIVRAPSGPTFQTHPDPDRYQQIQQALAGGGYFKGEVNGKWGDDSVAALKQFQTEHNLVNDGKISSLSLINLGLGPSREAATKPVADSTSPPGNTPAPEPVRNE